MIGRPSTYTDELAVVICERIADGETLRAVCRDETMPARSTVHLWLTQHKSFSDQYVHATNARSDIWADEIVEIADESSAIAQTNEAIQRSKLRIDTRKWLMSKAAPKKYGDKVAIDGDGEGGPIKLDLGSTELARRLAFLLMKGAKGTEEGA